MLSRWTIVVVMLTLGTTGVAHTEVLRQQSSRDWDARTLTGIQVENPSGDIRVSPSRDGRVHLVALKLIRNASAQDAERLSRERQLVADLDSGELRITVRYPTGRQIRLNVWDLMRHIQWPEFDLKLALEIPAGLGVSLKSASGDLQTQALTGRQQLHSSSGDIDVEGAGGPLSIDTRSGDVTVDRVARASIGTTSGNVVVVAASEPLGVVTRSGDVRIDSATDSVTVDTGSGEVRVGLARRGLDARTGSGDITARAGGGVRVETSSGTTKLALMAPLQRADLTSGSGDVTLRVAAGIECSIDAEAGSGDVEVNLPLAVRSSKDNHVIGRIGRGSSAIIIRTSSGSISVAR